MICTLARLVEEVYTSRGTVFQKGNTTLGHIISYLFDKHSVLSPYHWAFYVTFNF